MSEGALTGLQILQTRPAHQQQGLTDLLHAEGAQVWSYPSIAISEVARSETEIQALKQQIDHSDLAIFVSRNAIEQAFKIIPAKRWPASCQLAVIGSGSARFLRQQGLQQAFSPDSEFNSEGLLKKLHQQPLKGKNILIFRGQAGRNLLGDQLREGGAQVDYIEIYHRHCPNPPAFDLDQKLRHQKPDMIIFTSAEGLRNLWQMVNSESRALLLTCPWCLISSRMQQTAQQLGHTGSCLIATEASDKGIMQALKIALESPQDD